VTAISETRTRRIADVPLLVGQLLLSQLERVHQAAPIERAWSAILVIRPDHPVVARVVFVVLVKGFVALLKCAAEEVAAALAVDDERRTKRLLSEGQRPSRDRKRGRRGDEGRR
jgi:hypothetical protein